MKYFILIIGLLSFITNIKASGIDNKVHGTATYSGNHVYMNIYNDSDSAIYILSSYFQEGWSNSKWFYRGSVCPPTLKLSFVPIAVYLTFGLRPDVFVVPDTYIENKLLNSSRGRIVAHLEFDTVPPNSVKSFSLLTQNFRNIKEVVEDHENISYYGKKKFKFKPIKKIKSKEWYIELAIYNNIQYMNNRNIILEGLQEFKMYEQLFGYSPLLIKIEM